MQAKIKEKRDLRLVRTMIDDPGWEGETRRIDAGMLRDHLGGELRDFRYLIAGPPPVVEGMADALGEAGVPEEQVRPERFSGY